MGRLFLVFVLIWALTFAYLSDDTVSAQIELDKNPYILADIRYELTPDFANIVISSNKVIDYIIYAEGKPYKIIIDLIGVSFCELEQSVKAEKGPVKSIEIVKTESTARPPGLGRYFYAVDYIVVKLDEKRTYQDYASKDGKVVVLQITTEKASSYAVSDKLLQAESAIPIRPIEATPKKGIIVSGEEEIKVPAPAFKAPSAKAPLAAIKPQPPAIKPQPPAILEGVEYEVYPDKSSVALSSNLYIDAQIHERKDPYRLLIKPKKVLFCQLQDFMQTEEGLVSSIKIAKAPDIKLPKSLNESFYPVDYVEIRPAAQFPYNYYRSDNGKVMIVQIKERTKPKEEAMALPKPPAEEEILAAPPPGGIPAKEDVGSAIFTPSEKRQIVDEIAQGLYKRQEELFARQQEEEEKKRMLREARAKAKAIRGMERIGIEEIKEIMEERGPVIELEECANIGAANYEPLKIVEEEIELSNMKLKESFRALFPNVKLKGSKTKGDVLGVDFIEKVYGVEGQQPVYQGGRLWNTYQQSRVNLKVTKVRYNKLLHDLKFKIAENYYNMVTSKMNLKLQNELLKKTEPIFKAARARHSSGLSTNLELFNVKSQYDQVLFQVASAERDLALARFKLEQAMGLDVSKQQIGEADTALGFEIIEVDLNRCMELAQDNHPDIIVNKLLVESNEYEEKIAKGKDAFNIDITGFYGRAGSYYETEDEKMGKDWNIGVKVSKPFWGNTTSYSFTKEETNRKVGQTDRTGSTVHAGEFAILDRMDVASGIQEAMIKRHRSEDELLETRRQINLEIKEAYYNYQEAVLRVKNALEKVRFQKEAVKTAKAQTELNEALQSQLFEAEIKLADERSIYIKALSDYNLSLVRLNKAIGIEDFFTIKKMSEPM